MKTLTLIAVFGLTTLSFGWSSPGRQAGDIAYLVGDWSGTSLCQVRPSACNDEHVVFHFSNPQVDKITVAADKIVDGKLVNMGSGVWTYDQPARTLRWEIPRGLWKFTVDGDSMGGTLSGPDNVIFRKVHLRRSK
jgi:hypothetical protein